MKNLDFVVSFDLVEADFIKEFQGVPVLLLSNLFFCLHSLKSLWVFCAKARVSLYFPKPQFFIHCCKNIFNRIKANMIWYLQKQKALLI